MCVLWSLIKAITHSPLLHLFISPAAAAELEVHPVANATAERERERERERENSRRAQYRGLEPAAPPPLRASPFVHPHLMSHILWELELALLYYTRWHL